MHRETEPLSHELPARDSDDHRVGGARLPAQAEGSGAVSRRMPLSAAEGQESRASAADQPKLMRMSCTCRGPSQQRPGVSS